MTTLRVRRVEAGDIPFGCGQAAFASKGEATLQLVAMNLKLYLGEWALDATAGVPWRESILKRGVSDVTAAAILKAVILQTDGVKSLRNFTQTLDRNTRALTVNAVVETVDGLSTFTGVLP